MSFLNSWVTTNDFLLFCVYGFAFMHLSLHTYLCRTQTSQYTLARHGKWLVLFGLGQASIAMIDMYLAVKSGVLSPAAAYLASHTKIFANAFTGMCLMQFGLNLLGIRWLKLLPVLFLTTWVTGFYVLGRITDNLDQWLTYADLTARYGLITPAGIAAAVGFLFYRKVLPITSGFRCIRRRMTAAGVVLLLYCLSVGAVGPMAPFMPAAVLHEGAFLQYTGMPIFVMRAVLAVITALAVTGVMKLFRMELFTAWQELATFQAETDRVIAAQVPRLASVGRNLTHMSEQLTFFSKQLTLTFQEMATNLQQPRTNYAAVADSLTEMTKALEKSATALRELMETVGDASRAARTGEELLGKTIEQLKGIDFAPPAPPAPVEKHIAAVKQLGERAGEITKIINTISTIAGQMELLIINSAIEATRSGAQGQGFITLAENVRNLVQQLVVATEKILEQAVTSQQEAKTLLGEMGKKPTVTPEQPPGLALALQTLEEARGACRKTGSLMTDMARRLSDAAAGTEDAVRDYMTVAAQLKKEEPPSAPRVLAAASIHPGALVADLITVSGDLAKITAELRTLEGKIHPG